MRRRLMRRRLMRRRLMRRRLMRRRLMRHRLMRRRLMGLERCRCSRHRLRSTWSASFAPLTAAAPAGSTAPSSCCLRQCCMSPSPSGSPRPALRWGASPQAERWQKPPRKRRPRGRRARCRCKHGCLFRFHNFCHAAPSRLGAQSQEKFHHLHLLRMSRRHKGRLIKV